MARRRAENVMRRLRDRVTIQTATVGDDGYGGQTVSWANGDTVWAHVEPTNGREFYQMGALQNAMGYRVTLRYHASVTPLVRLVVSSGPTLEVVQVIDEDLRHVWVLADAVQVDA